MKLPVLAAALLCGLAVLRPAQAQAPAALPGMRISAEDSRGLQIARDLAPRVVRVTGRRGLGAQAAGEGGYGLIVGEVADDTGGAMLVIVTPDHIVRDPAQPDRRFQPPMVTFRADGAVRQLPAELMADRVAPAAGDLAVIKVPRPSDFRLQRTAMSLTSILLPGSPVWQAGRRNEVAPANQPGVYRHNDADGWMLFDGLENDGVTAGSVVVSSEGIVGMMMGPLERERALSRVASINFIATRVRAWGHAWDIDDPGDDQRVTPSLVRPPGALTGLELLPIRLVTLLPSEIATRSSWVPKGARLSTWADAPARLFASPRRDSAVVGSIPAGIHLPQDAWRQGAYEVGQKLDGGAWFLVQTGGDALGWAAGKDVVEIWPPAEVAGMSGGKVVREWTSPAGRPALLRDTGNAFELETSLPCRRPLCNVLLAYTPAPPSAGATVPSFQVQPISGMWREGDTVALRLLLPRRVADARTTRLMGCIGIDEDCAEEALIPPATP